MPDIIVLNLHIFTHSSRGQQAKSDVDVDFDFDVGRDCDKRELNNFTLHAIIGSDCDCNTDTVCVC